MASACADSPDSDPIMSDGMTDDGAGDDSSGDDGAGREPTPEPHPEPKPGPIDDGCATPIMGNLTGTARLRLVGAGGYNETSATVLWTIAETTACVDRYEPTGKATADWAVGFCSPMSFDPAEATIAKADGSLLLDRSVWPPTYVASGKTEWMATETCALPDGDEVTDGSTGGDWLADGVGTVDGTTLHGLIDEGSRVVEWNFGLAGAVAP
jgi:hypothetical protein